MFEIVILKILLGKYHYAAYYSVDAILWFTQREGSVDISRDHRKESSSVFLSRNSVELLNLAADSGA
jgi:hypothetical protein